MSDEPKTLEVSVDDSGRVAVPKVNGTELRTVRSIDIHLSGTDVPRATLELDVISMLLTLQVELGTRDNLVAVVDEALSDFLPDYRLRRWAAEDVVAALYRHAGLECVVPVKDGSRVSNESE